MPINHSKFLSGIFPQIETVSEVYCPSNDQMLVQDVSESLSKPRMLLNRGLNVPEFLVEQTIDKFDK